MVTMKLNHGKVKLFFKVIVISVVVLLAVILSQKIVLEQNFVCEEQMDVIDCNRWLMDLNCTSKLCQSIEKQNQYHYDDCVNQTQSEIVCVKKKIPGGGIMDIPNTLVLDTLGNISIGTKIGALMIGVGVIALTVVGIIKLRRRNKKMVKQNQSEGTMQADLVVPLPPQQPQQQPYVEQQPQLSNEEYELFQVMKEEMKEKISKKRLEIEYANLKKRLSEIEEKLGLKLGSVTKKIVLKKKPKRDEEMLDEALDFGE